MAAIHYSKTNKRQGLGLMAWAGGLFSFPFFLFYFFAGPISTAMWRHLPWLNRITLKANRVT